MRTHTFSFKPIRLLSFLLKFRFTENLTQSLHTQTWSGCDDDEDRVAVSTEYNWEYSFKLTRAYQSLPGAEHTVLTLLLWRRGDFKSNNFDAATSQRVIPGCEAFRGWLPLFLRLHLMCVINTSPDGNSIPWLSQNRALRKITLRLPVELSVPVQIERSTTLLRHFFCYRSLTMMTFKKFTLLTKLKR